MSTVQQPGQVQPKNGTGTAALVLGILAVVFAFIPLVGIVLGPIFGLIAIILGILGMKRANARVASNKGASIAGLVLGIIGVVIAIIAAVIASAVVASVDEAVESAAPSSSATAAPAQETQDVLVNSCTPGEFGQVSADLTVTNSDDAARSYLITVSVNGPDGNRLAEANAAANSIAPGQVAQVQAIGSITDPPAELTCVVANVSSS
ncbi:hypothetical protein GTQ99_00730 [Kineococcus sp. T13]|uniref:DUF4190 domain-containing protein n=1 Tax=Kineococcus vitellinus TaxID=2696565 RepID=UPI001412A480|nr:DUF4190 domain-containing protein [Kineococcus vitellinus]NAZ73957.1 hypothetical protein [Kineococcus vitellinus]